MGPLWQPGYILTLDSPIAINWDTSAYWWGVSDGPESVFAATYNSAPIATALRALQWLLPDWVVQRLYLVLIFWLCGVGAYRLPFLSGPSRYYAGLFYAVNPFTYIRFVTGQWGVLGAYALMPFALGSFISLLERPDPKKAVQVALVLSAIGLLQVHGLALTLALLGLVYLAHGLKGRDGLLRPLPMLALLTALFTGMNLFWIVRLAVASGGVASDLRMEELDYFAAYPPLAVLSLRGFWLSYEYLDIADLFPLWWVLFLPLLYLSVLGAAWLIRQPRTRWLGTALVAASLISAFLAASPGIPIVSNVARFLWEHVPTYSAFRDSHKFAAILALGYAYMGAFGLKATVHSLRAARPDRMAIARALGLVMPALPLLYSLPVFGAWGQLRPTDFPQEWYEVRAVLNADEDDYNVLVLPWQMYTDFPWLENRWKRLANPAPGFFAQPTISGDNLEIGAVSSDSVNPVSAYVEAVLDRAQDSRSFGALIAPLNARYVVLFDAPDYRSYGFLTWQQDMEPLYEGETISLYRNLSPASRAYVVRGLSCDSHSEAGCMDGDHTPQMADVTRVSRISYRVTTEEAGYLIFTVPQHTTRHGWSYDGQDAALHLGMMPAFEATPGTGTVSFSKFYRLYLPAYLVSAATLALAVVVYLRYKAASSGDGGDE